MGQGVSALPAPEELGSGRGQRGLSGCGQVEEHKHVSLVNFRYFDLDPRNPQMVRFYHMGNREDSFP